MQETIKRDRMISTGTPDWACNIAGVLRQKRPVLTAKS